MLGVDLDVKLDGISCLGYQKENRLTRGLPMDTTRGVSELMLYVLLVMDQRASSDAVPCEI